jgi:nucleotide-binding universal stress UspA family protein
MSGWPSRATLEQRPGRMRVKIIERDRAVAERAADALERTIVLHGDGLDMELLEEAAVERADAVLCGDRRRQDQPAGGGPRQDRRLCLWPLR